MKALYLISSRNSRGEEAFSNSLLETICKINNSIGLNEGPNSIKILMGLDVGIRDHWGVDKDRLIILNGNYIK